VTPIDEVAAGYAAAVSAADVDAFVELYDDDVRVFDTWGRWSYDGLVEWRAMVREWFGSLGDEHARAERGRLGRRGRRRRGARGRHLPGLLGRRRGAALRRQPPHVGAPTEARRRVEDRPRAHVGPDRPRTSRPVPPG
jgi:hypothetical protein